MKTLMISTAALLLAGAAFAQTSLDSNADGMIDRDEFRASFGDSAFGTWDTNGDQMLSRSEYEAGVDAQNDADSYSAWDDRYGEWDSDQDEMLSADEYDEGLWSEFDADQNDMWSGEETAAWQLDELRFDATRSGRQVSK
jgi:hypothetical protein